MNQHFSARPLEKVRKRDNRLVDFDKSKIVDALYAAFDAVGNQHKEHAPELSDVVCHCLVETMGEAHPRIEEIQDVVEKVLVETNYPDVAKAYILYREQRSRQRKDLTIRNSKTQHLQRWNKNTLVEYLILDVGLCDTDAAVLSNKVEQILFKMGLATIASHLLLELVSNQLYEHGFTAESSLIRFPTAQIAQDLITKNASSIIYEKCTHALLATRATGALSESLEKRLIVAHGTDEYLSADAEGNWIISTIVIDAQRCAHTIGAGKLDAFCSFMHTQVALASDYFKLQLRHTADCLEARDDDSLKSLIQKCRSIASPLDTETCVRANIEIKNSSSALRFIMGSEEVDAVRNDILTKLMSIEQPKQAYQRITVFTQ